MPQTQRCASWRAIQFMKAAAVYDLVVNLGKDILVFDIDRYVTAVDKDFLVDFAHTAVDMYFDRTDTYPWPALWNIGKMYIKSTAASKSVVTEVARAIDSGWDQQLFNQAMIRAEKGGNFTCRSFLDGWRELPDREFREFPEAEQRENKLPHDDGTCVPHKDDKQRLCLCGLEKSLSPDAPRCHA